MTQAAVTPQPPAIRPARPVRLGFLGVGWIGRHRLEAVARSGLADVVAIADPSPEAADQARGCAPSAAVCGDIDALLRHNLDGLVIATPSALHADQAAFALQRRVAVFCQKPLARTADETRRVVDAARRADRLLGVDFSYRVTDAFRAVHAAISEGELGDVYAVDLTFHNAYGPDKPWFRDARLSGGGCVIDLGVHLVDLAMVGLGWPSVEAVDADLYSAGRRLRSSGSTERSDAAEVEDFAVARLRTGRGAVVRLTCSWNVHAGRDAVIDATFFGENGGASIRNINGSFYDFRAELHHGTSRRTIAEPPDDWGGRAVTAWARQLAEDPCFTVDAERFVAVAEVIDRIYGR